MRLLKYRNWKYRKIMQAYRELRTIVKQNTCKYCGNKLVKGETLRYLTGFRKYETWQKLTCNKCGKTFWRLIKA